MHKVITGAIPDTVGDKLIGLLTTREEISDLLKLDDVIDLVIPRGSNKLVSDIKNVTKILVLGHSDGICHVYVDKSATLDKVKKIVLDAKTDYPAACNAMIQLLADLNLRKTPQLVELVEDNNAKNNVSVYFRGARVFNTIMEDLLAQGMKSASNVCCPPHYLKADSIIDVARRTGAQWAAKTRKCYIDRT